MPDEATRPAAKISKSGGSFVTAAPQRATRWSDRAIVAVSMLVDGRASSRCSLACENTEPTGLNREQKATKTRPGSVFLAVLAMHLRTQSPTESLPKEGIRTRQEGEPAR